MSPEVHIRSSHITPAKHLHLARPLDSRSSATIVDDQTYIDLTSSYNDTAIPQWYHDPIGLSVPSPSSAMRHAPIADHYEIVGDGLVKCNWNTGTSVVKSYKEAIRLKSDTGSTFVIIPIIGQNAEMAPSGRWKSQCDVLVPNGQSSLTLDQDFRTMWRSKEQSIIDEDLGLAFNPSDQPEVWNLQGLHDRWKRSLFSRLSGAGSASAVPGNWEVDRVIWDLSNLSQADQAAPHLLFSRPSQPSSSTVRGTQESGPSQTNLQPLLAASQQAWQHHTENYSNFTYIKDEPTD